MKKVFYFAAITILLNNSAFSQELKSNPLSFNLSYDTSVDTSVNVQLGYMFANTWEIVGKFSLDKYFIGVNSYLFEKEPNKLKTSLGIFLGAVKDDVIMFSQINPNGEQTEMYIVSIRVPLQITYALSSKLYLRTEFGGNYGINPNSGTTDPSYENIDAQGVYFNFEAGIGYRF